MTDRKLFTYVELGGVSHLVGKLWAHSLWGRQIATFEYDEVWLANPVRFAFEPALLLTSDPHR